MSLCWNSRIIAEARLARVHGQRIAGGFGLRLGLDFSVTNWTEDSQFPLVLLLPSTALLGGSQPLVLGRAHPETPQPFTISQHSSGPRGALFDLALSPAAMDALERARNGAGVSLTVKLQAEIRRGSEVLIAHDDVTATFTVSDWLVALEQCGYGRSMLFEVPLPESATGEEPWTKLLGNARGQFLQGNYAQTVASCRMVLESLTKELKQEDKIKASKTQHKTDRTALSVDQRELVLRQAAIDYSSLAHHVDGGVPDELYGRRSAQMLLAMTAALVSSALGRQADGERQRL